MYCEGVDPNSGYVAIKIANRSAPRIILPNWVDKTLTYSQPEFYAPKNQGNRPRFLIIIDFEATCDFSPNPKVTSESSEIIEFPWVVLDTISKSIIHENRFYIKPDNMEGITNYCTRLTGITKEDCVGGISLREAINQFNQYIRQHLFPYGENNFRIVTDSVWDLQVQLRKESERKKIPLGSFPFFSLLYSPPARPLPASSPPSPFSL